MRSEDANADAIDGALPLESAVVDVDVVDGVIVITAAFDDNDDVDDDVESNDDDGVDWSWGVLEFSDARAANAVADFVECDCVDDDNTNRWF